MLPPGGSHAVFVLIDPDETYSHSSVDKRLAVLWKTDALRGTISVRIHGCFETLLSFSSH